jgi:hypothetical protein
VAALVLAALPPDLTEAFANHTSLTSALPAKVVSAYWITFVVYGAEADELWRHQLLVVPSRHTSSRPGSAMSQQIRAIAALDRVFHEPGRLMIVALLYAMDRADFLYLQHETGMNKGTLSSRISRLEEA